MEGDDSLRGYLARLLGWAREREMDQALRSLDAAAAHRAHLVLCGVGDLVPIALALHRRTLGIDRPFVVCDPRRRNTAASVRAPANHNTGVAALAAAAGGSLCMRRYRLPADLSSVVPQLQAANDVQYVVCSAANDEIDPLLVLPAPIRIPPLTDREQELPRIVEAYAADAIATLGVGETSFTERDRTWILEHAISTISEIEKTTLRLVAVRASSNMSHAAARLGMAPVSLSRWIDRRQLRRLLGAA
ncbi:MAG TPA: hypothetical protein VFP84_37815 [Kofleriaceae bacterium]|nr:hypothetical protein [Kofleriaceae bacterium]